MTAPAPRPAIATDLSPALVRALIVLGDGHADMSNITDRARRRIYWQSARRLEELGLAQDLTHYGARYCITPGGEKALAFAREVGWPGSDR